MLGTKSFLKQCVFVLQHYNRRLSSGFHSCQMTFFSLVQRLALVSWGRTLELSTIHTSAVCDWLEAVEAAVTGTNPNDLAATRNYSLLLIRPAEQHALPVKPSRTNTMVGRLFRSD